MHCETCGESHEHGTDGCAGGEAPCETTSLRRLGPEVRPGVGEGDLVWRNTSDGSVLVHMPGGGFDMGSDVLTEAERPPHRVGVRAFWISRQPVTNAQFRHFLELTGHQAAFDWEGHLHRRGARAAGSWERFARLWGDDAPVVGVSYGDALAYCRWAHLRLPSEAEWEFAAVEAPIDGEPMAWVDDAPVLCELLDPGQLPAEAEMTSWRFTSSGIEMAWNVLEWCATRFRPYPYDPRDEARGRGPRVLRGGVWTCKDLPQHRELLRLRRPATGALLGYVGFRCAMDDA